MLTLWGRLSSSNVQAVRWCLHELALDYQRIDAGIHYGVTDTADYLERNPNGTVPMLCDGDAPPLWESGAILRYLAARYGNDSFWPHDAIARAEVDKWAEWAKINIAMNFTAPVFWRVVRTPTRQRDPHAIAEALARLERFLTIAEHVLASRAFLAADHLTLADIQFGHCLWRYFDIDIDRPALPALQAYHQRLCARDAYRDTVMVSYEELRGLAPDQGKR